ncbi:hypothetical protein BDN70DRAFT_925426 [Pholiota conissans]|uniref:Ty3 transposon capsid-like protein domain-containing protein n=1 Tax=Pholiota conissans TaxID=109636 RepID=A0A9P6CN11_9AGAR|nr:hypothetical protein BDN70DRAFT_925426 [Pholiota conissans]
MEEQEERDTHGLFSRPATLKYSEGVPGGYSSFSKLGTEEWEPERNIPLKPPKNMMAPSDDEPIAAEDLMINPPTVFDGNRKKLQIFLRQLRNCFMGAPSSFSRDGQKIAFALSYCVGGAAEAWVESFYTTKEDEAAKAVPPKEIEYGTWEDFENALKASFKQTDADKVAAIYDLNALRQVGGTTAEDHVTQFKILLSKSGLAETKDIILKFQTSLRPQLRRIISYGSVQPTTLAEWYKVAIEIDNLQRRIAEDIERDNRRNPVSVTAHKATSKALLRSGVRTIQASQTGTGYKGDKNKEREGHDDVDKEYAAWPQQGASLYTSGAEKGDGIRSQEECMDEADLGTGEWLWKSSSVPSDKPGS